MRLNRLRPFIQAAMLIAVLALLTGAARAQADESVCALADHIRAANTDIAVGACPAGTSHDVITITEDITLAEPLPAITGTITIEGGGHAISGAGKFRIFDVAGGNLTIRNLTLRDGKADDGGAIHSQAGSLAVHNSAFVSNRSEKSAGAIYADGGRLEISESRFEDNCAQLATYALRDGGNSDIRTIDAQGCVRIHYIRSEIDGKLELGVDGGAIRLLNGVQARIESATFTDNRATTGGAISTSSRDVRLAVSKSSFVGNHASRGGGAIGAVWSGGGATEISNSSFVENSAEQAGGAITAERNKVEIANSTFSQNRSEGKGGALAVGWDATVTVTHATFSENQGRSGEAMVKSDGTLRLRNSVVASSGSADDCAGGLDESVGNLSPDRTCGEPLGSETLLGDLTGAPAYHPPLDGSPAVDVAVAEYCLETDQIGTPRPQGGGCDIGAIESTTARAAAIEAQPFCPLPDQIIAANTDRPYKACKAGNGADTIYLVRDFVLTEKLQPITSHITIEGNGYTISGDKQFRIFDVDGGMLTVNNLTMIEGRASDGGGAIRLRNNGRAVVNDSRFLNNSGQHGAAVFIGWTGAQNSWLNVNRSSFVKNYGASDGGAIYAGSGSVSVSDSSFVENSTAAISMVNPIRLDVVNSTFYNNGRALRAQNGVAATLTHVTICCYRNPIWSEEYSYELPIRVNLRNSIVKGWGFTPEACAPLRQNIGNLIQDGSCSPIVSGDPLLADLTGSPAYLDLQAGSPAINAADPRFCPETDQLGRKRPVVGRCDIGAVQSIPVRQALADCAVTTTHGLNLRDEPNGVVIGAVRINETLTPLARTPGWFQVEYLSQSGWISADYVDMEGDCA